MAEAASGSAKGDMDEHTERFLSDAWEGSAVIRNRFRREIAWLQYPVAGNTAPLKKGDAHAPSTRALESNVEVLSLMLDFYSFEFLHVHVLQQEAGQLWSYVQGYRLNPE